MSIAVRTRYPAFANLPDAGFGGQFVHIHPTVRWRPEPVLGLPDEQYLVRFADLRGAPPPVYLWSFGFRLASEEDADVLWVCARAFSHELGNQLPKRSYRSRL